MNVKHGSGHWLPLTGRFGDRFSVCKQNLFSEVMELIIICSTDKYFTDILMFIILIQFMNNPMQYRYVETPIIISMQGTLTITDGAKDASNVIFSTFLKV